MTQPILKKIDDRLSKIEASQELIQAEMINMKYILAELRPLRNAFERLNSDVNFYKDLMAKITSAYSSSVPTIEFKLSELDEQMQQTYLTLKKITEDQEARAKKREAKRD